MMDFSVYPDTKAPTDLESDEVKADYVARICGAWDFGIVPTPATFELFSGWRTIFDQFPISTSIAYHAFRSAFDWPRVAGEILEAPYERMDRRDGRTDPCTGTV